MAIILSNVFGETLSKYIKEKKQSLLVTSVVALAAVTYFVLRYLEVF
jgi:hypothetical protein